MLFIAGILKLVMPDNLVEVLLFFELLEQRFAYLFTYTISVVEIIMGIALVYKKESQMVQKSVLFLFGGFLGISLIGYFDNWQFACGCLGRFSFGRFDLIMVLRNTVFVIMTLWISYEDNITKRLLQMGYINTNNKRGIIK